MMPTPPSTERIRFREYREDDLERVAVMFSDADARRFYPEMAKLENCRRWITWNLENYAEHGFGLWVIEDASTGAFLGDCGLTYQLVEGERLLELGYHLILDKRGRGFVTEAGRTCIEYAFDNLGHDFVCSTVHPDNTPSRRVAGRLHSNERPYRKEDGTFRILYWSRAPSS